MKLKILEKDVLHACMDYLKLKHIFHRRQNTGATTVHNSQGPDRFVRFGALGAGDIYAVINGRHIEIECKGSAGTQSPAQKEYQEELEDAGGVYILVHDVEELNKELTQLQGK